MRRSTTLLSLITFFTFLMLLTTLTTDTGVQAGIETETQTSSQEATTLNTAIEKIEKDSQVVSIEQDPQVDVIPNDPLYDDQWGLSNIGQTGGTVDADIDAPEAWNVTTGDTGGPGIALLDTGVDINHEDLAGNLWGNPEEFPNDGVDNDGNGYIDDVHGWDFYNNDQTLYDSPVYDNHGTNIAGIIAAVGNNWKGMTGLNWDTELMVLKVCGSTGCSESAIISAIQYAKNQGAKIINATGIGGSDFSQDLKDAIETCNCLFITSAGNSAGNIDSSPFYPASYDSANIIAVAATDHNDQLAGFSNYGASTVDLGAPGVDIITTAISNTYALKSGTSYAGAFVAGVATLIHTESWGTTVTQTKEVILNSVDNIPSMTGISVTEGRLNANNALGGPPDITPPSAVNDLEATTAPTSGSVDLVWTAPGDDGSHGTAIEYIVRHNSQPITESNWNSSINVDGEPTPRPASYREYLEVSNLEPGQTYYFAIKTNDEVPNTSDISNSSSAVAGGEPTDTMPPAAVNDLQATTGNIAGSVNLRWTAPGDDGSVGTANQYVLRYNSQPITYSNWNSSSNVSGEPTPNPAGSLENMTVSNLTPGQTYYFAIRSSDEVPNTSDISNSSSAVAGGEPTDTMPPAAVNDLQATTGNTAGSVNLSWTSPGDDGNVGTANEYVLRYNSQPITGSNWNSSTNVNGEPTPRPAGSLENLTVSNLAPGQTYYFAIKTNDEVPNTSDISNSPSAVSRSGSVGISPYYVPLALNNVTYIPPVNVYDEHTDLDGIISIPLTGGGEASIRITDMLEQPVANVPVMAAENEDGITLIIMPQEQGYIPLITSIPASNFAAFGNRPDAPPWVVRMVGWWKNPSVPYEWDIRRISGHIEALAREVEGVVKETISSINVCTVVDAGHVVLILVYPPATVAEAATHGGLFVASHVACEALLHADFGSYDFSHYFGSDNDTLPNTHILVPSPDNLEGLVFGDVADADTGIGISGAAVSLDSNSTVSTLNQGGYVLWGLSPGQHSLTVSPPGYSLANQTFSVSAGQVLELDDLVVEVEDPGTLRIVNITGGRLTAEVETQAAVDIADDSYQDWILPAGYYHVTAWTTACGGVYEDEWRVFAGSMTIVPLICAFQGGLSLSTTELPSHEYISSK